MARGNDPRGAPVSTAWLLLLGLAACDGGSDHAAAAPPRAVEALGFPLDGLAPELVARIEAEREPLEPTTREPRAWRELGLLYEANRLLPAALPAYETARALGDDSAELWYRLASVHGELGEHAATVAALEHTIERAPDYAPAHSRLGLLLLDAGELERAEAALRAATRCDPEDPGGWLGLARLHLARDEPAAALELLDRVLARRPGDRYARGLRAAALRGLGRQVEAEREGATAGSAPPRLDDPWNARLEPYRVHTFRSRFSEANRLFEAGRVREALTRLEELTREAPDDLEVLNALGTCLALAQRFDEARAAFEASLALEPDQRATLLNLALVQETLGRPEDALATLARAIENSPTYARLHETRGDVLARAQRPAQAIDAYRTALEHDQRGSAVRMKLGTQELALRRWEDAAATFGVLLERDDTPPAALLGLAQARTMLGAFDDAERLLERAARSGALADKDLRRARAELERRRAASGGGGR